MSNALDIDNNPVRWMDAFANYQNDEPVVCPICGDENVSIQAGCGADCVGFIMLTCKGCGKTGYLSRVRFQEKKRDMVSL
jgi:hypothetical protein